MTCIILSDRTHTRPILSLHKMMNRVGGAGTAKVDDCPLYSAQWTHWRHCATLRCTCCSSTHLWTHWQTGSPDTASTDLWTHWQTGSPDTASTDLWTHWQTGSPDTASTDLWKHWQTGSPDTASTDLWTHWQTSSPDKAAATMLTVLGFAEGTRVGRILEGQGETGWGGSGGGSPLGYPSTVHPGGRQVSIRHRKDPRRALYAACQSVYDPKGRLPSISAVPP